jgi:hypothetical protein
MHLQVYYTLKMNKTFLNTSMTYNGMNCNKISEAHIWRYSKHTKIRRCLKCKSRIPITEKEYHLKWGMHENITK